MHESTQVTGYLDLIAASNAFPGKLTTGDLYQLFLPRDDRPHGFLLPRIVKETPWTSDFRVLHDSKRVEVLDSSDGQHTSMAVNRAFAKVVAACKERDDFALLRDRGDEWRAIVGAAYPVRLYRYAQSMFGIIGQGVHLTAYTWTSEGLKLWVARRSTTIDTCPNMLDNTAAGAVPAELTPLEAMIEEARDEASLPPDLVRRDIRAAGMLSYVTLTSANEGDMHGLVVPDMIYVYDMELSEDTVPKPRDDEVQAFFLMEIEEVKERLLRQEFKGNCALVLIDFFIRHGIVTAETDRDYAEMSVRLHRVLPFDTAPKR